MHRYIAAVLFTVGALQQCGTAHGISIQFDYSLDVNNFFDTPAKKDALEMAADVYETRLFDRLLAITRREGESWSANFSHPAGLSDQFCIIYNGTPACTQIRKSVTIENLAVPADTLIVFVGGYDLAPGRIAEAQAGSSSATGSPEWTTLVERRGQGTSTGIGAIDFAPWGGFISFDTAVDWVTERQPGVIYPSPNVDILSAATHELGHILGIGTANSWRNRVDEAANQFTGNSVVEAYGSPVDLSIDRSHWAAGTKSVDLIRGLTQDAIFNASAPSGKTHYLTQLDLAGLADIGWIVVPEPSGGGLAFVGIVALTYTQCRRYGGPRRRN
jgi:hypothetical protein